MLRHTALQSLSSQMEAPASISGSHTVEQEHLCPVGCPQAPETIDHSPADSAVWLDPLLWPHVPICTAAQ